MSTSINFPIEIKSSRRINLIGHSSINRVKLQIVFDLKILGCFDLM